VQLDLSDDEAAARQAKPEASAVKPYRGPPMTLGAAAAAQARLIVWCRACSRRALNP
jgi:hypothetical protein